MVPDIIIIKVLKFSHYMKKNSSVLQKCKRWQLKAFLAESTPCYFISHQILLIICK